MNRTASIVLVLGVLLAACRPTSDGPGAGADTSAVVTDTTSSHVTAALVPGAYQGVLPCADCPGIDTRVTFADDSTFQKSTLYQGRDKQPRLARGTWRPDTAGVVVVTLQGEPQPEFYRVLTDTTIAVMSADRKDIEGATAPVYVLVRRGAPAGAATSGPPGEPGASGAPHASDAPAAMGGTAPRGGGTTPTP